jgi:hypothetical protein
MEKHLSDIWQAVGKGLLDSHIQGVLAHDVSCCIGQNDTTEAL